MSSMWPPREEGASADPDRSAVWPPSPHSLQKLRPRTATEKEFSAPGSPLAETLTLTTSLTGRIEPKLRAMQSGPPNHPGAGVEQLQEYEGFGPASPAPFSRGFVKQKELDDVGADLETLVAAKLQYLRLDFKKRRLIPEPIQFQRMNPDFASEEHAEAVCAEAATFLQLCNDQLLSHRMRLFAIEVEGHAEGPTTADSIELSRRYIELT